MPLPPDWYRTPKGMAAIGAGALLLGTLVGMATAGGDPDDTGRRLPSSTTAAVSTTSTSSTSSSSTTSTSTTAPPPSSSSSTSSAPAPPPVPVPGPTVPDITTTTLLGDP